MATEKGNLGSMQHLGDNRLPGAGHGVTRFRVQRKRAAGDNAACAEFSSLPPTWAILSSRIAEDAGENDFCFND